LGQLVDDTAEVSKTLLFRFYGKIDFKASGCRSPCSGGASLTRAVFASGIHLLTASDQRFMAVCPAEDSSTDMIRSAITNSPETLCSRLQQCGLDKVARLCMRKVIKRETMRGKF
jgi:hypothetical protein